MVLCGLYRRRLARTELFVDLEKSFFSVCSLILLHYRLCDTLVLAVGLLDLLVGACFADSTKEGSERYLSVLIYADVNNVVGILLILKPRTAVRDYL